MSTESQLENARQRLEDAQATVKRLEAQREKELSLARTLGPATEVHIVLRRTFDSGRFERIEAVFSDFHVAEQYAHDLGGYGVGIDVFIETHAGFGFSDE